MLRWCRQPSPSKATLGFFLFVTWAEPGPGRGYQVHLNSSIGSAARWSLLSRAELDHEVGGRRGVGRLRKSRARRACREVEELVDHDVVRDLRVLEQAGRVLPLTGRTFSWVTKSMASLKAHQEPTLYNRAVRLSPAGVARLDRVDADMDQVGLGHGVPRSCRTTLSRISSTTRPASVSRSGKAKPEQLRKFRTAAFDKLIGREGSDLEALSNFPTITSDDFGKSIGLEVRSLRGPMSLSKAAVRNFPKLFWFAFPLLDTLAGLVVDGDPRQRWSDKILGPPWPSPTDPCPRPPDRGERRRRR